MAASPRLKRIAAKTRCCVYKDPFVMAKSALVSNSLALPKSDRP